MKRFYINIIALLIPALAVLLLWQIAGPARLRPADLAGADRISGFYASEAGDAGAIRWGGPNARLTLPAGGLPGALVLRGAVAPATQVRVSLGDAPAVALPPGGETPQLRRYAMLVPASSDDLGWAELIIRADPSARVDGRALGMALSEVKIVPTSHGPRMPPLFAWLMLAGLPTLIALVLILAGMPRRPSVIGAVAGGLALAWIWARAPEAVYGPLLDMRALLGEPLIWRWWLLTQLAGLSAWPIARRLLRGLPLAGYPLAKALGLLLITWIAWALSIAGILPFGLPSVLIATALVAGSAWLLLGASLQTPFLWDLGGEAAQITQKNNEGAAKPPPHPHRRGWLEGMLAYELLFLGGLLLGVWLRWHGAVGPALTGTEKPMEIAILNAVLRYGQFPPLDPWLAGFGLNYYYLGYVIVAALALVSGAAPAVAFNLGFALIIALTVVGVAYAAHALVALSPGPVGPGPGRPARVGVALLALLLCLALGSQTSALQLIVGSPLARALDAGQLASALAQRLAGAELIRLDPPTPQSWAGPSFDVIVPTGEPSYDWFTPSRALYDDVALPEGGIERRFAITEFPAFSLYLGDLHPHILAMPFDLLALAAALALLIDRRSPTAMRPAAYGLLVGCLYCINSWDAPTYALLGAGALALGLRAGPGFVWRIYVLRLAAMAGASLLAALPFLLTFRPPAAPVAGSVAGLPILSRIASALGLAQNHTQLHSFLIVFGLFMLPVVLLLFPQHARLSAIGYRLSAIGSCLILGPLIGFPLLFLIPLTVLLAARAWSPSLSLGRSLAAWVAAVGCLTILVPEVVYIRDHLEGEMSRMITIFKFYYQAWVLLSIVAAYAAWAGLRSSRRAAWLWGLPAVLLLAGALVYPLGLLRWAEPWQPAERSLDGLAFLARQQPEELAAARWMAANIVPDEVVLTGFCNSCDYEQASRVAAISGVQTVLGWMDGHERVWRSGYPAQLAEIAARERDIPAIYAAADMAAARTLLDHYGVSYLYLGPVERGLYGDTAATFARDLPVAFSQGDITIYRMP